MPRILVALMMCTVLLSAVDAIAAPLRLKLAYFSSDRTSTFASAIRPFAEAVNADDGGHVQIEVLANGVLGKNPAAQLQLLADGRADIVFALPGYSPELFPDSAVVQLPGLFANLREGSLVFTKLIEAGALRRFEDYTVIGAFVTEAETIHMRPAVTALSDLQGKRVRANNPITAATLGKLGMHPVFVPITQVATDLAKGELDGAAVPPAPLFEFGIGRLATYHYLLPLGGAPMVLLMRRATFEALPADVRKVVRAHGGTWLAERFSEAQEAHLGDMLQRLRSDPQRHVVTPTQEERAVAEVAFREVASEWAAGTSRNAELMHALAEALSSVRAGQ